MIKRTKVGLISGIVILILLIGAVIALVATKPQPKDDDDAPTSVLAYEKNYKTIKSLYYKNKYGEAHISMDKDGNWIAEEYPGISLDQEYTTMVARSASKVVLRGDIAMNTDDMAQFGFDEPSIEVKVEFDDAANTVKEFKIGNPLVTEGRSYFAFDGENNVYWIMNSDFDALTYHPYSIIDRYVLPEIKRTDTMPKIDYVNVKRADLDYEIQADYDELAQEKVSSSVVATHKLVKPVNVPLDPYNSTSYIKGMYGLRASNIVEVNPSEEVLNKAGIFINSNETEDNSDVDTEVKSSAAVIEMKADGKIYRLHLGTPMELSPSEVYGYLEGRNILYSFKAEELPWLILKPTNLVYSTLITYGIYDVAKIEASSGSNKSEFVLSGDDAQTFTSVLNGEEVDKEYFRSFYTFLLSVSPDDVHLEVPDSAEPMATIILTPRKQANDVIKLDFYDGGDRNAIVVQNDKPIYTCRLAFVEKLKENIKLLENKEKIIAVW